MRRKMKKPQMGRRVLFKNEDNPKLIRIDDIILLRDDDDNICTYKVLGYDRKEKLLYVQNLDDDQKRRRWINPNHFELVSKRPKIKECYLYE